MRPGEAGEQVLMLIAAVIAVVALAIGVGVGWWTGSVMIGVVTTLTAVGAGGLWVRFG